MVMNMKMVRRIALIGAGVMGVAAVNCTAARDAQSPGGETTAEYTNNAPTPAAGYAAEPAAPPADSAYTDELGDMSVAAKKDERRQQAQEGRASSGVFESGSLGHDWGTGLKSKKPERSEAVLEKKLQQSEKNVARRVRDEGEGSVFIDYGVNPTIETLAEPTSTFAVDVDTASYALVRSYLQQNNLPPEAAVRVEEVINAFDYGYESPGSDAFLVQAEAFPSPNRRGYHLLHLGIKGREVAKAERAAANLVFVIDTSGSMDQDNRLGLVKRSLGMLLDQLDGRDTVAIVTYEDSARVVANPTRVTFDGREQLRSVVNGLYTGGSTNAEAGLTLGYGLAERMARSGASNRVILCSDGMANTGDTSARSILGRVARAVKERNITLTSVGVGMSDYNDVMLEQLADAGNGNYAFVDGPAQARRVFVEQLAGTLQVIAKDVKIQMRFNPNTVARYRLIGFENRALANHDFDNDNVDAGELGAGHTVTALYEVKLHPDTRGPLGELAVRYKHPEGNRSAKIERELPMSVVRESYAQASAPAKLSMVAAGFGEKLRGSYWARNLTYDDLLALWQQIPAGLREQPSVLELHGLITAAQRLDRRGDRFERYVPVAMMDFDRVPVLR